MGLDQASILGGLDQGCEALVPLFQLMTGPQASRPWGPAVLVAQGFGVLPDVVAQPR
jgi:hypothetical protein